MKAHHWAILGTVWMAMTIAGWLGYIYVSKEPPVVPTPSPVVPSGNLATLQAIAAKEPTVARELGAGFLAFADVVVRDESAIKTNSQLINAIAVFESLLVAKTDAVGKLPGCSAAVEAHLKAAIGNEDATLKRAESITALKEIAAALGAK